MNQPPAPRQFFATPGLPGAGLPNDRQSRIAARRAFVGLKRCFEQAVEFVSPDPAGWLRTQVRRAEDPMDLWLLRAPVFAALAGPQAERRALRHQLRRSLDSIFPESEFASGFQSF